MNSQEAIQHAAIRYANRGWHVVILHAPHAGGCTCMNGRACESPGKHPRGKAWQVNATTSNEEQLLELFDKWPKSNIGLLLGPKSGVIDIEFDSDAGRLAADQYLQEVYTPTYRSSRGIHRLFQWTPELPQITKADVEGLEVWIGGDGDKATQSVLPPSIHGSGAAYAWLPGLSPEEVELAELPAAILARLWNVGAGDDKIHEAKPSARQIVGAPISEGGRNDKLYRFACSQARRSPNIDDATEQSDLVELIRAMNVAQCVPPLDDSEVKKLCTSAIGFIRRERSQAGSRTSGYTLHGLVYEHGEWWPGDWELTIVLSDPPHYRLHVPAWQEYTVDGAGDVTMTVDAYRDPAKVAAAVQAATRKIILDEVPRVWPAIWNGREGKRANDEGPAEPPRRGLKAKLLDAARTENPPTMAKRHVIVAEYLAEKLSQMHDADRPDDLGGPVRIKPEGARDYEVWFKWRKLWQDGLMTGHIAKPEPAELAARLGVAKNDQRLYPPRGAARARYTVLTPAHLTKLEQLLEGEDRLAATTAAMEGSAP